MAPVCQPVGMVVVSTGASLSSKVLLTVTACESWSLQLPALSCTRDLSVCAPWPTTVASGVLLTGPLSICHSTPATPESASVPVMVILWPLPTAAPGAVVVLTGFTESMRIVSGRQVE